MPPEADLLVPSEGGATSGWSPRLLHGRNWGDRLFVSSLLALGLGVLLIGGVLLWVLWRMGWPALKSIGILKFVAGSDWDPVQESFGSLPFVYGTLVTS